MGWSPRCEGRWLRPVSTASLAGSRVLAGARLLGGWLATGGVEVRLGGGWGTTGGIPLRDAPLRVSPGSGVDPSSCWVL